MAISGAVFQMGCEKGKYAEFLPLVANKVKRLLVPFSATALFVLAPTIVLCGKTDLGYWGTVFDIFKGGFFVKHLWYLQALFWIFLLAWVVKRFMLSLPIVFLASIAIQVCLSTLGVETNRYFSLGMALNKLPMFVLGMMLMNRGKAVVYWILGVLVLGGAQVMCKQPIVDHCISFLLSASIVGLLFEISNHIFRGLKDSRMLAFIVKNSFGIYLFHMTPIYFIRYWGCDDWPLWVSVPATFVFSLIASIAFAMLVRACRLGVLIGEK